MREGLVGSEGVTEGVVDSPANDGQGHRQKQNTCPRGVRVTLSDRHQSRAQDTSRMRLSINRSFSVST